MENGIIIYGEVHRDTRIPRHERTPVADFVLKQAAFGNQKASFHCAHRHCIMHANNAVLYADYPSRDAKSCVSQARMRNEMR